MNEIGASNNNPKTDKVSINEETGRANGVIFERKNNFRFNKAAGETVLGHKNNSWIVLGRDRMGKTSHGYGGRGHGKDSSIDIVVGRMSSTDSSKLKGRPVNPNPFADAARLYLSQKSDIDDYFNIAKGYSKSPIGKSAALLKADDVRLVGRRSIKLVTGTDGKTSNNEIIDIKSGIELIGGNEDSDMQEMVKGKNLENALIAILSRIDQLNGFVKEFYNLQHEFNQKIGKHTHYSMFLAKQGSFSPELLAASKFTKEAMEIKVGQSLTNFVGNIMNTKNEFLIASSKTYILSTYHRLN